MQSSIDGCEFLTVEEAAIRLRIKEGTIYNCINQDPIPFRKHGGRVVLELGELQRWSKDRAKGLLQLGGENEINDIQLK
ncbi:MAG: helix-turn-helix domain-containing protein [Bdellovibrionales bacterium]|nr:helix-turn-helix domain-containing protein [Bdellovibrionales bacterium]